MKFKNLIRTLTAISMTLSTSLFAAENAVNLDALLKKLEQGQYQQSQQNKQREKTFIQQRSERDRLLNEAVNKREEQVKRSETLETNFEENEIKIANLNEALNKRLGSLKELFGVLQQVSGDTKSKFSTSIISAEYPDRGEFLSSLAEKMGSSSELASIEEIERVWFELQREMTESGKISRFEKEITLADGQKEKRSIVRVGSFNLIDDGQYLEWIDETQTVAQLTRQPTDRFQSTAADLYQLKDGYTGFALDPTGGSILGLLIQAPNTQEYIEQGGVVGYVILALGLIALLIAAERYIVLFLTEQKVKRQLKSNELKDNNPLGRVLKVKEKYANVASDTLELKLSEAILKEIPRLTRSITFIKIISVVAPLLGLLGTVTGMINTFQAITLFGTGDPKLMAGGISTALVTTVLGLVVAIPTVLLFTWLNTRSKNILHILQEQSAGIIAERAEQGQ
ncbi:MotA/TolQ/ExbB proton channel family protein [Aliikangiella maris]|uniref:MotA/TolQ/ExbB proton channel family protein n=2 Tax=Aliikangiella maris TaxID=3162458 RepID=A0ABV2BSG7_9GAMM